METTSIPQPLEVDLDPWRQVTARADAFFQQVAAACHQQMRCAPGCVDCCQQDLEVLLVEALAVLDALDRLPPEVSRSLGRGGGACSLLLEDGTCAEYGARPLICRTHGLPIRYGDLEHPEADHEVEISCCALNFTAAAPPAGAVLNGTLLLAGLSVADSMARQQLGAREVVRVPLSRLVTRRWDALAGVMDKNG